MLAEPQIPPAGPGGTQPPGDRALAMWVSRNDLHQVHWHLDDHPASTPLAEGQVRLRIDLAALTANNVTYGAFGDAMRYWDFFPTGEAGWGQIPTWGFADVTASQVPGLAVGTRVYGYFPMAQEVTLEPTQIGASGFADGAAHRRELHPLYNRYQRCDVDPLYAKADEGLIAVLRPLFTTSFLIDDLIADRGLASDTEILLSSASSKTAYATAWCLAQRTGCEVVGLTSARNLDFVRRLGLYGRVATYDGVAQLPKRRSVYVDFAGAGGLRAAVHGHLGDELQTSWAVGATDWQHTGSGQRLPGPRPELFFAPTQLHKRLADWGRDGFAQRLAAAWQGFVRAATSSPNPWLRIREVSGRAGIEAAYREVLAGAQAPDEGLVLRWTGAG
jgi:hypothetical protein